VIYVNANAVCDSCKKSRPVLLPAGGVVTPLSIPVESLSVDGWRFEGTAATCEDCLGHAALPDPTEDTVPLEIAP
jgi:hypothetical protein